MQKIIIILFFLFHAISLFAQKEDYNWLLSDKVINFNSNPASWNPNPITSSNYRFRTNICMSDSTGQLLFSVIADSVKSGNNVLYQDGFLKIQLPFQSYSAYSIAPYPLENDKYWLYRQQFGFLNGLNVDSMRQYLVDIKLNKVTFISASNPSYEYYQGPLGIVVSDSCEFSWMVEYLADNSTNNFLTDLNLKATKIGINGIDTNKTVSSIIPLNSVLGIHISNYYKLLGASENGRKFAIELYDQSTKQSFIIIVDFDNKTGRFSLNKIIDLSLKLEFNLSASYLTNFRWWQGYFTHNFKYYYFYANNYPSDVYTNLYRINLTNNVNELVVENVSLISKYENDIRLGSDYSMVFTKYIKNQNSYTGQVWQIQDPEKDDITGMKMDLIINNLSQFYQSFSGFPMNYSNKRGYRGINVSNTCLGDSTNFSATDLCIGNIPIWNFNDGNGTVVGMNVKHKYASSGEYIVDVIYGNELIKKKVTILGKPLKPNLGIDTQLVCKSPFLINLTQTGVSIRWQDGTYRSTYTATSTGMYTVTVSNGCFASSDTVNLHFSNPPIILKDSIVPCNVAVSLDGGQIFDTYQWSTGGNSRFISVTTPGTYWVKSTNSCGLVSDTVKITWKSPIPPKVNHRPGLIGISDSCISNSIGFSFKDTIGVKSLDWDFGDGEKANAFIPTHKFSNPQTYFITAKATHLCYVDSSSRKISIEQIPYTNLGLDTVADCGQPIILSAGVGFKNYQWQDGSSFSTLTVLGSGTYSVRVFNACGSVSDTIEIKKRPVVFPNVFTPNSDGKNDELLLGNYLPKTGKLYILNRWGEEVFKSEQYQNDWKAENLVSDGLYFYRFENGCERVQGYLQVLR